MYPTGNSENCLGPKGIRDPIDSMIVPKPDKAITADHMNIMTDMNLAHEPV